jgi:hypothetical protein
VLNTSVSCSPQSLREVVFKRPLSWWPGGKKEVSKAMRYTKFMLAPAAAGAALILSCPQTARADFSGPYAPPNWTFNPNGQTGSFVNDGVTLTLTGHNSSIFTLNVNTDYTIAAAASGTWSFDWDYASIDSSDFDDGGYLLNGLYTVLAYNDPQSGFPGGPGSVSISVNAGDIIGFRVHSLDSISGPGVLTITNFVAPVPAPGSLALLGLAAASGRSRRRRC